MFGFLEFSIAANIYTGYFHCRVSRFWFLAHVSQEDVFLSSVTQTLQLRPSEDTTTVCMSVHPYDIVASRNFIWPHVQRRNLSFLTPVRCGGSPFLQDHHGTPNQDKCISAAAGLKPQPAENRRSPLSSINLTGAVIEQSLPATGTSLTIHPLNLSSAESAAVTQCSTADQGGGTPGRVAALSLSGYQWPYRQQKWEG